MNAQHLVSPPAILQRFHGFGKILLLLIAAASLAACTGPASQRVGCVIASNDGPNGFRTDEISNCRIELSNGNASFTAGNKQRSRSYASMQPLTQRHLNVANYWLNRSGQLRVPAQTNPAGFNPRAFLQAASKATDGFVLIRNKGKGGQAVNIVYITNGVYRSIDFSGTDFTETPSGFLTTRP